DSTKLARGVLDELGLTPGNLDALQTLPVEELLRAGFNAINKLGMNAMMGWSPVVDGTILPEQPFGERAPEVSKDIPMLVGTIYHEFINRDDNPDAYKLTDAEMESKLRETLKDKAGALITASRKVFPELAPFDRYALLGNWFRTTARRQVQLKAAQGGAPAYYYWFTWRTPVLDGRPGAFHSCEISYVFDNADRYEGYNGGGDAPRRLSDQMSDAWLAFARTGNPNHPGLPEWPAYQPTDGATMVFDDPCRVADDPDLLLERAMAE
ncbi:MAG: carboxylesterase family protein, partial [Chloroflexi bacterium]|nr:carboxylesterase family protein [Chloroflexota bacterium]